MKPDDVTDLLAAISTGAPSLPGAVCHRRAPLFDDRHDGESSGRRLEAAAAVY